MHFKVLVVFAFTLHIYWHLCKAANLYRLFTIILYWSKATFMVYLKKNIYIYVYIYILYIYIYMYYYIYIYYIYICIIIYIKLDNRMYSSTIRYSCTVNVDLMLICVELSKLIIYCKYARKFLVFEVIYYIFLYYTFLPIHS